MRMNKISTKTLREKIYDQLRKKIVNAELLPGQRIRIRDLAKEFGVSAMPVREALWQLESERVIFIESNKSIRVNTLTAKEMEELLRIRLMLESMAAERSCERRPHSILSKLKGLLDEMEASIENPKRYMAKNSQFHLTLYSCADSPLLLQIIDWMWARVGPHLSVQALNTDLTNVAKDWEYHREMYLAFYKKDGKRLKQALRKDLEEAAKFIIPLLEN